MDITLEFSIRTEEEGDDRWGGWFGRWPRGKCGPIKKIKARKRKEREVVSFFFFIPFLISFLLFDLQISN
jgi:hypothetical protein